MRICIAASAPFLPSLRAQHRRSLGSYECGLVELVRARELSAASKPALPEGGPGFRSFQHLALPGSRHCGTEAARGLLHGRAAQGTVQRLCCLLGQAMGAPLKACAS